MNYLFVDNLTVIDFSYFDNLRGILGESWIVDIVLEGELDDQGMVFDFGDVKKKIKNIIDTEVDHKLVLPKQYPQLTVEQKNNALTVSFITECNDQYIHQSPFDAVLLLPVEQITPIAVSDYLSRTIKSQLPENVSAVSISLRTEAIDGPFYHYSHGLKKHKGNCQRIAHGHRSKIDISIDNKLSLTESKQWADTFKDIYIGTQEDIFMQTNDAVTFKYTADQGQFALTLPKHRVYFIDTDSTVEWIATHIAKQVKLKYPDNTVIVKAFEGVGKGAIAKR